MLAISNVVDASIPRRSNGVPTRTPDPRSVASTKAFTTQLTAFYLLSLAWGANLGRLDEHRGRRRWCSISRTCRASRMATLSRKPQIEKIAKPYGHASDFLYLGRGINYPIALEGALKLKEISHIHAEGYPPAR